jgi:hypothetical protein
VAVAMRIKLKANEEAENKRIICLLPRPWEPLGEVDKSGKRIPQIPSIREMIDTEGYGYQLTDYDF